MHTPTPSSDTPASVHTYAPRILVFDSGVGGLSILQEIRKQYPHCCFFYASDNAAFPYGTKTATTLIERVDNVLHQLHTKTQADIIVVACNTASTIALPRIRERFSVPVIGVVPAIKPAAAISDSKVIGLLATPGTITRDYTEQLIREFANDCNIVRVGSSELVLLAEQKLRGEPLDDRKIGEIVEPFRSDPKIDTIILACTHFPLLKDELKIALPSIKHWIDSGEAIARRVGYWLEQLQIPTETHIQESSHKETNSNDIPTAYFTGNDHKIELLRDYLHNVGITRLECL